MKILNSFTIKFSVLIIFNNSIKTLSILGTYWDDAGYIQTTPIIYDKIRIFYEYDNLSRHFNYNLEFYGYLFHLLWIYLVILNNSIICKVYY